MKLHFWGGADTVTGSQHIIEAGGRRVLRDCGLYQGRRDEANVINRRIPFDVRSLDSVVLSHAHIDHCGNLPSLAAQGYDGPIHATAATEAIAGIMLRDAAHIQEQDAAYLNQRKSRKGLPLVEPLYTVADAEAAIRLFRSHGYRQRFEAAPGIETEFWDAGHILGSALSLFLLQEGGRSSRIGFAVDLGRKGLPLIRDPEVIPDLDILVIESTYGNRLHADSQQADDQLQDVVKRTIARGGKVIIPSFALERAQELIYHLSGLMHLGRLPELPIYIDSPMAQSVTRVFNNMPEYLDDEARNLFSKMGCLMCPDWVHFAGTVEESKAVTAINKPCIVIAASGMCEHGRILHHLKNGIGNPANTVAIVGFQAAHTLGRRLVEKSPKVSIFGDEYEVKAEVAVLNAFSAHADRNDLLGYIRAARPRRIYLVHGESEQRTALAEAIRAEKLGDVFLPARGDAVEI